MKNNTILYGALAVAALALMKRKPVSGVGAIRRKEDGRQLNLFTDMELQPEDGLSYGRTVSPEIRAHIERNTDEAMLAMQDHVANERAGRYSYIDDGYYADGTPVEYIDIDDGSVYHYGDSIDIWKITGAWGAPREKRELIYTIEGAELENAYQIIQSMHAKAMRFGYILEVVYNIDDKQSLEWRGNLSKHIAGISGISDPEASLENIRRGVANGWYTAKRTMVNGKTAVELTGKLKDGSSFTDVYPVSQETYNSLT